MRIDGMTVDEFYAHLAGNPRTPRGLLEGLGRRALEWGSIPLARALARNPKTPTGILRELEEALGVNVWREIALNPKAPGDLLEKALRGGTWEALGNPNLPRATWEGYQGADPGEFPWVLAHPETPLDHGEWWELPWGRREEAFRAVLHNPRMREAGEEVLERLLRVLGGMSGVLFVHETPYAPVSLRLEAIWRRGETAGDHKTVESRLRFLSLREAREFLEGWYLYLEGRARRDWGRRAKDLEELSFYRGLLGLGKDFWELEPEGEDRAVWRSVARFRLRYEEIPNPLALLEEEAEERAHLLLDPSLPLETLLCLLEDKDERVQALAEAHPLWAIL